MTAEDIRKLIVESLEAQILAAGVDPAEVRDDFDLLGSGLIDSMGFLNLVVAIEDHLGEEMDLENLDPDQLTKIGPLCKFIEAQAGNN